MPTGMKFYQEVGNTAYVSFNTFEINDDVDYYQALAEGEQIADTIGVIMYAHAQITRENSPIENVVLDLSLNTGGRAGRGGIYHRLVPGRVQPPVYRRHHRRAGVHDLLCRRQRRPRV